MRPSSRVAALAVSALVAGGAVALTAAPATAASADVAISQIYGGGGNSGATLTNDFIELRNTSAAAVDVTGWSVQYAAAAGTTWQVTALSGSVPAGGHYLVQEAPGAGGTTPLPAPDATGLVPMSATAGKVALVTATGALACGSDCDTAPEVKDFVGYGSTANDFETAPAPGLSNTTAAIRGTGPDTDNNAADFTAGTPNPRNTGSTEPPPDPGVPGLSIADIQGTAHRSPREGVKVAEVPGVVTAVGRNGFWFQDPTPDADPRTSDGLFVFTSSAPAVAVGDAVTVTGTIAEFRPGSDANNLTLTELTAPTVTVTASGQPVPGPTVVGPGGRVPPSSVVEDDATGDVETAGVLFDPDEDGLDFWESLEGMRLEVDDASVVGPRSSFGELPVVPAGATVRTDRGGILLRETDPNPERVILDDVLAPVPVANVGDRLASATVGVLDYSFANYKLLVTASPTVVSGGLPREVTRLSTNVELAVATFNVENLDPGDPQSKFDALAARSSRTSAAPDLVALEEMQDNNGTDERLPSSPPTRRWPGSSPRSPRSAVRRTSGVRSTRSTTPTGASRAATSGSRFLFRTDRGLSFVDRPGGDGHHRDPGGGDAGRQAPADASPPAGSTRPTRPGRPAASRWPASSARRDKPLFVIANHFNSKGGDQPLYGRFQPPTRLVGGAAARPGHAGPRLRRGDRAR